MRTVVLRPARARPALHPARRAGFTLVEVLVALVIFAMTAVVLGSAYLNVLNSYEAVSRGMRINEDFAFARQQLLTEPDRKKVEEGGEFESVTGARFKWTAEISSTAVPNVFNVAFTCESTETGNLTPVKQSQTFTVLRPSWVEDVAERDKLKADFKTRILELQGKKQP